MSKTKQNPAFSYSWPLSKASTMYNPDAAGVAHAIIWEHWPHLFSRLECPVVNDVYTKIFGNNKKFNNTSKHEATGFKSSATTNALKIDVPV